MKTADLAEKHENYYGLYSVTEPDQTRRRFNCCCVVLWSSSNIKRWKDRFSGAIAARQNVCLTNV